MMSSVSSRQSAAELAGPYSLNPAAPGANACASGMTMIMGTAFLLAIRESMIQCALSVCGQRGLRPELARYLHFGRFWGPIAERNSAVTEQFRRNDRRRLPRAPGGSVSRGFGFLW